MIFHKYWKNNLKTIAVPQLLYDSGLIITNDLCIDNIYIDSIYLKMLCVIILNYFIRMSYSKEQNKSLIFRFNYTLFYFFITYLMG